MLETDVDTYEESALDVNLNVVEPRDVHNRIDIIRGITEDYSALMPAIFKCLDDGRSIVCCIATACLHMACLPMSYSGRDCR